MTTHIRVLVAGACCAAALMAGRIIAQTPAPAVAAVPATPGITLDETVPPGANFDKADFRLWLPNDVAAFQGVVVLVPGSNGDGRPEAGDAAWQAFAAKYKLALVGVHLTDKPHDQNFIEAYADVSKGSGQALLDTLTTFAAKSKHPELASAPLFLWGMSSGGEVNNEFVNWNPERVAAFVVNKGGIYYTALASKAARAVPGLLFIGGKDLESRIDIITGLFALNRRGGAVWALAEEPAAAHIVGRSKELAMMFYEDLLPLRIGDAGALKPINEKDGFVGDIHAKTFQPAATASTANATTDWFPTERVAKAWQAMVTEKPFDR